MAINFREIAQKELSMSPLMAGRMQVKTEDIINTELTLMEFDFATITDEGETKIFPVVTFKERPGEYYNGGALLKKLCDVWAAEYDGDFATASEDLKESGGVKVILRAGRTKKGNNLTSIEVL